MSSQHTPGPDEMTDEQKKTGETIIPDETELHMRIARGVAEYLDAAGVFGPIVLSQVFRDRIAKLVQNILLDMGATEWEALTQNAWRLTEIGLNARVIRFRISPELPETAQYFPVRMAHIREAQKEELAKGGPLYRMPRDCVTVIRSAVQFCSCGEVIWVVDPWELHHALSRCQTDPNASLLAEAPKMFDLLEDFAALDASAAPLNEMSADKLIERAIALVKRIRQSTTRPPDIREA